LVLGPCVRGWRRYVGRPRRLGGCGWAATGRPSPWRPHDPVVCRQKTHQW